MRQIDLMIGGLDTTYDADTEKVLQADMILIKSILLQFNLLCNKSKNDFSTGSTENTKTNSNFCAKDPKKGKKRRKTRRAKKVSDISNCLFSLIYDFSALSHSLRIHLPQRSPLTVA